MLYFNTQVQPHFITRCFSHTCVEICVDGLDTFSNTPKNEEPLTTAKSNITK